MTLDWGRHRVRVRVTAALLVVQKVLITPKKGAKKMQVHFFFTMHQAL